MISVAILALVLTAIFSSQAASVKMHHRSRKTTVATLLARCKMLEVEELLFEEGLPAIDRTGSDACCEHAEQEGFVCDWTVSTLELPEPGMETLEDEGDEDATGEEADVSPETAMQDMLTGQAAAGGGMMSELAMQYAYPVLVPALQEQVRRIDVRVSWTEGKRDQHLDVMQFYVAEPPAPAPGETADQPEDGAGDGL